MPSYQPNKLFVEADFGHLNVGFDKLQAEIALGRVRIAWILHSGV